MLRTILLFTVVIAASLQGHSQQRQDFSPPNYELIASETKDKNSTNYYPTLLKRYKNNDTTLNAKQMHLLYYGKFFNDELFDGAAEFVWRDSINAIYKKETLTDEDRKKLLAYNLHIHNAIPFDLRTTTHLARLCEKLNDQRASAYSHMLIAIARTIAATGDGQTQNSGFHIGSVADEYSFLPFLRVEYGGSQSLIDNCDYLTVKENKYDLKGVYFNIEQILKEERKALGMDPAMEQRVLELMKKVKKTDKK